MRGGRTSKGLQQGRAHYYPQLAFIFIRRDNSYAINNIYPTGRGRLDCEMKRKMICASFSLWRKFGIIFPNERRAGKYKKM